ncbi:MAG: HAMP domain-containing sensor histidine kinase [Lactobacillus sp.]|nr:HAMP domain-containing sensor histidine kinase [Lactobacillus sp.]
MKKQRVKLTTTEKSELIVEAIVTIILLLLLNLSIVILIHLTFLQDPNLKHGVFFFREHFLLFNGEISSAAQIVTLIMIVGDFVVLYWRLTRRYRQMQLRHIIDELHDIAEGNFDHRINFLVNRNLQKVVESINLLIDSTVNTMSEERAIEKSKDELITNISHDIRTPLTSIIGYLGLLKQENISAEDQAKYLDIAYNKANQMKSLVNDLFEYTKLSSTDAKLNIVKINIYSMLEQIAAGFELEASNHNISIEVTARPKDLEIEADPEKLVRVFNNLIGNAFKYGKTATKIVLEANLVNKDQVELRVENNGEPIEDKLLKRIFDRLYRVETSRNSETGGTGLGLAITKGVVELHHGSVRCESNKDWTSFIIRLPLKATVL